MNERTTALPRKLLDYTSDPIPTQRRLREDAVNGKFPAHQVNGIWHYDTADLPVIAAAYGLKPKAASQPEPQRRRKAVDAPASAIAA